MTTRVHEDDPLRAVERARRLARRAVAQMAVDDESLVVARETAHGPRDVDPMAGFRAAHELEVTAASPLGTACGRRARLARPGMTSG